jgi:23S rRNA (adenine2030-N6)-methyltransferase
VNYRHAFHAGGLADIVKHLVLVHILKRLTEKPTSLCVMDTHAARGLYDLNAEETTRGGEAEEGVFAFVKCAKADALAPLQDIIEKYNPGLTWGPDAHAAPLRTYPGSPSIIRHYLREGDRLIAVERHPEDFKALAKLFAQDKQVNTHERNAAEAVRALLPPKEKRLFVFSDPPYERAEEPIEALKTLKEAHARVRGATLALWYPVKDPIAVGMLHEDFAKSDFDKILRIEVPFYPEIIAGRLNGSGILLINPPWKIEESLEKAFADLRALLPDALPPTLEWVRGP